jgi:NADH-quinone oxidoreductase subunit N
MNLGAFAVIIFCIEKDRKGEFIKDYRGLTGIHPAITFLLALFFLSLAGIPPTGGFVAKFYILAAAIDAGYYILAAVGVVSTAISLFFYTRVIFYMYMREPETDKKLSISVHGKLILGLLALGVIILGIYPEPFINFALNSIKGLL